MRRASIVRLLLLPCVVLLSSSLSAETTVGKGETLTVATRHVPPFAIKASDGSWSGISIDLWRTLSERLGLQSEFREMQLRPMLDAVANGQVDAAVAALTITAEREARMDFSHPFLSSGLGIAVPHEAGSGWMAVIQRLISEQFLKVVTALSGLLLLVGVLVWLVERRRNSQFGGTPVHGIGSGLWWSAVTMTTVGYGDKAPQTFSGRALAIIWMFASVIIISSFTAAIATALTVGELGGKVKSKDDLARARLVSVHGSTSAQYLTDRRFDYSPVEDITEALARLSERRVDAVVYDAPILRYRVKQEFAGSLAVLAGSFERQDYGIALPSGSSLREPLNRALLEQLRDPAWETTLFTYLGGR